MTLRITDQPQPGHYKLRRVRGGPWVPALIYRPCPMDPETGVAVDRFYHLQAEIGGNEAYLDHVWIYGRPIPRKEWLYMSDLAAWAASYAPEAPEANPFDAVDLNSLNPIF